VLNVFVPEVVLQGPRVVAVVRELEPTGTAKHVRMDREWHLGGLADALNKPVETNRVNWPATLENEDASLNLYQRCPVRRDRSATPGGVGLFLKEQCYPDRVELHYFGATDGGRSVSATSLRSSAAWHAGI
jgi:hypothetical protein